VSTDNATPSGPEIDSGKPEFPRDFDLSSVRTSASGEGVARQSNGRWWWIDAGARPTVVRGIRGVDAAVGHEPADAQAKQWGFDLLVPPLADAFVQRGNRHLQELGLLRIGGGAIREEGVGLPDVFDPAWEEAVEQCLNGLRPSPGWGGWISDSELRWGGWPSAEKELTRPGLLQVCLSLDPTKRVYHSAWEFVLARHGGELSAVAHAWQLELNSRGNVRELTRRETVICSPGYQVDLADFTREFAQRYFNVWREAVAKINPACLLTSPVLGPHTPPPVREAAVAHCDLILTTVPGLAEGMTPELWLVSGWNASDLMSPLSLGESNLEAVLRNGRQSLSRGLQHPAVVGYVWDRFRGGDLAVDDPFATGLVDDSGRINSVLTQPLTALNFAALSIRCESPD